MTGGDGSRGRRTAKSVEAAATGPPQAPLRSCSSKSKRKAGKEAAPTGPHGSSEGSSTKRKAAKDPASCRKPLPRATRRNAKDAEEEEEETAMGAPVEDKYRYLSNADIRWILSLKPLEPPARYAALKRSNPALTPQPGEEADEDKRRLYRVAKAFFEMEEGLPRTQEWVRSELRRKGCVELDTDRAMRRAEAQAVIDREWPAIEEKMKALILSEKKGPAGGADSDSDDGKGSDESEDEEEDELYY